MRRVNNRILTGNRTVLMRQDGFRAVCLPQSDVMETKEILKQVQGADVARRGYCVEHVNEYNDLPETVDIYDAWRTEPRWSSGPWRWINCIDVIERTPLVNGPQPSQMMTVASSHSTLSEALRAFGIPWDMDIIGPNQDHGQEGYLFLMRWGIVVGSSSRRILAASILPNCDHLAGADWDDVEAREAKAYASVTLIVPTATD